VLKAKLRSSKRRAKVRIYVNEDFADVTSEGIEMDLEAARNLQGLLIPNPQGE
jgi:hypothetical protein